jgi:HPt (histidine-containing phosphotransfer) domain-containing protein
MTTSRDQLARNIGHYDDAATRALLNVADGIDRVMGDHVLYARMLLRFHKDYASGLEPIVAALDAADRRRAHNLTHALKGAAGMIGAYAVQDHACALECALRSASNRQHDALERLAPALKAVLALLETMISACGQDGAPAPVAGAREGAALLAQLTCLLQTGDGGALDLLEQSDGALRRLLGPARFQGLCGALHDFDFDAALALLGNA